MQIKCDLYLSAEALRRFTVKYLEESEMIAHVLESITTNRFSRFCSIGLLIAYPMIATYAADYDEEEREWQFESGLDKSSFAQRAQELSDSDFRIVDLESYRSGRSPSVTTVWAKINEGDMWLVEMKLPVSDFNRANEKYTSEGYALVEFEIDRTGGANLHFSGVWLKSLEPITTEFFLGMESLEYSNRYGEMADRGYRQIDFEAYESNGKFRHAGLWIQNDESEVRFYRGIEKRNWSEVVDVMQQQGFRMIDIEGYIFNGQFVFAGEWVRMTEGQESVFAFDLLADEFYNKNSTHTRNGFRLTEFEVYEDNGAAYYAGSWLKSAPSSITSRKKEVEKKEPMSLEAFRSDED